jgi:hypothetical protein
MNIACKRKGSSCTAIVFTLSLEDIKFVSSHYIFKHEPREEVLDTV